MHLSRFNLDGAATSFRCGAVRIFQFPVDAGSRLEVLDNYMSVDGLVGVAGSVSAAFVAWTFSKPGRDRLWRCCEAASMPQSDRSELLSSVEFGACCPNPTRRFVFMWSSFFLFVT